MPGYNRREQQFYQVIFKTLHYPALRKPRLCEGSLPDRTLFCEPPTVFANHQQFSQIGNSNSNGFSGRASSLGIICVRVCRIEITISSEPRIRINKYICESGIYSRKAADIHVKHGVVFINGKQAALGDKVSPGDKVTVKGQLVEPLTPDNILFIMLNKPVGVVCTAATREKRNVVDFVNHASRIYPIGRLDKDSQGLIFLTNQCDLVDKILRADHQHEKEYKVTVNKEITDDFITGIRRGVPMLGVVTKPCTAVKESRFVFTITLVQGLNRQIRRMCKHYNYKVEKLERIRIMHMKPTDLLPGQWRELTSDELSNLYQALTLSSELNSG